MIVTTKFVWAVGLILLKTSVNAIKKGIGNEFEEQSHLSLRKGSKSIRVSPQKYHWLLRVDS